MARFKDKIKELMTKYSISEDAAKEFLDVYDGDMGEINANLREAVSKVNEWNTWYAGEAPRLSAKELEYQALQAKLLAAETALGVRPAEPVTPAAPQNSNFDPDALENKIYQNFSLVQKDMYNIQRQHMANYKELPDLEPIEKLIQEKHLSPMAAYQEWVAPMDQKRRETELRATIEKELTEKWQAEATRRGTNAIYNRPPSEAVSPLDEDIIAPVPEPTKPGAAAVPSELELMADFVGTMRNGRSGVNH